jgi:methylglutaconyl-CoA hydratase
MLVTRLTPITSKASHKRASTRKYTSGTYKSISLTEGEHSSLYITLTRPSIHNAFDENLIRELTDAFVKVPSKYRSVVLTGAGQSFSAGADLNWMQKMTNYTKEENEHDAHLLFDMFHSIRSCRAPVIARVNGNAFGGGAGLLASCDISFAVSTALFGFTEVKLGLIPAVISPFVMEKIGKGNASRLFLTGERFSGETALLVGLVHELFKEEKEMDLAVTKALKEIETAGPRAVEKCKILIQSVATMSLADPNTKKFVASQIAEARVSEEGQNGLKAFLTKQKPEWLKK